MDKQTIDQLVIIARDQGNEGLADTFRRIGEQGANQEIIRYERYFRSWLKLLDSILEALGTDTDELSKNPTGTRKKFLKKHEAVTKLVEYIDILKS